MTFLRSVPGIITLIHCHAKTNLLKFENVKTLIFTLVGLILHSLFNLSASSLVDLLFNHMQTYIKYSASLNAPHMI
jgi:hypothetical protein